MDALAPPAERLAYRPAELAIALGVSMSTLNRYLASGTIPARKLGDVTLIAADEVREMLKGLPRADYAAMRDTAA